METKRELTNDEKTLLIGLMPETLKFATALVLNGIEYDEVICYIYELSGLEKIIRSQLLKRLSHYHLKNEAALAAESLQKQQYRRRRNAQSRFGIPSETLCSRYAAVF